MKLNDIAKVARDANPHVNRYVSVTSLKAVRELESAAQWLDLHCVRSGRPSRRLLNGRDNRLSAKPGDGVAATASNPGVLEYERETTPVWYALSARATTIPDIGANTGLFSLISPLATQRQLFLPLSLDESRLSPSKRFSR